MKRNLLQSCVLMPWKEADVLYLKTTISLPSHSNCEVSDCVLFLEFDRALFNWEM